MGWLSSIGSLILAVKYIFEIGVQIIKLLREYYDRAERAKVAKEIRDAIKESRETLDNSRLINVFDPNRLPWPRGPRSVRKETDPGVQG